MTVKKLFQSHRQTIPYVIERNTACLNYFFYSSSFDDEYNIATGCTIVKKNL